MRGRLTLEPLDGQPRLRSIDEGDLEDLRTWKNANRQWFFHKAEIAPEGQRRWFEGYLSRPDDVMFVAESGALRAGCLGFRVENGYADCYNIIASPEGRGKGLLKAAMRLMCSYILAERAPRAGLQVLVGNPAARFYEACGFAVTETREGYHQMILRADFQPARYRAATT